MTLRELQHMADGRERTAWSHTLAVGIMVAKSISGKGPNVLDLIPKRYREAPKPTLTEAEEDALAEIAFRGLASDLKTWSADNPR